MPHDDDEIPFEHATPTDHEQEQAAELEPAQQTSIAQQLTPFDINLETPKAPKPATVTSAEHHKTETVNISSTPSTTFPAAT
ncbi:hypothetical protein V6N13_009139 [Hibiscus sabdariffa]